MTHSEDFLLEHTDFDVVYTNFFFLLEASPPLIELGFCVSSDSSGACLLLSITITDKHY